MASLGVNIDHIANIRQARRTVEPDPVPFALLAELGGADEVARALERIESLKKSGLITDSEYEAKRAEVLRRL